MNIGQAMQLAVSHHQAGRLVEADQIYRQVLKQIPNYAPALHLRGLLVGQAEQVDQGIELIRQAIGIDAAVAQYHHDLGLLLMRAARHEEAVAAIGDAGRLRPESADEQNTHGVALKNAGQLDQAIAAYRRALQINPDFAEAQNNLALALRSKGDLDESIAAARRAVQLMPDSAVAYNTLGMALADITRSDEAVAAFSKAIEIDPNYATAHLNLAMRLLLLGDFKRGWAEYQWRWGVDAPAAFHPSTESHWDGSDLHGQRILLHSERGLGDTIQFVRYVELVAGRGGRVILGVQPELARLFEKMPGVEQVIARGQPLPQFDQHCPLMSLPMIFATELDSIPSRVPYVLADAGLVEAKKQQLNLRGDQLAVGLAWAGNPAYLYDRHRSIGLASLGPLGAVEGATFYSLQKGIAAGQPRPPGLELVDAARDVTDFADTAAIVANLDLVITSDTSVAHLAGAMGKPVWVLLPHIPDWRWLLDRTDSPWYSTMRLFRQSAPGDWAGVMRAVAKQLGDRVRMQTRD